MSETSSASTASMALKTADTVLEDTLADRAFALAEDDSGIANAAFKALAGKVAGAATADYDYVYHRTKAAGAASIEVGDSLAGSNGIVSTGNGADTVDLSKSSGSNLVALGNGNDAAKGGSGSDIVRGENGNDMLAGGGSNDRIDGGNGRDTIEGGSDHGRFVHTAAATADTAGTVTFVAGDILAGGKGPDTFVYKTGDGVDHITDFRVGQDKLVLHGIVFDDLRSTTKDGDLYLGFDDGAGGWIEDAVIRIDNVTDLHALQNSNGLLFA
jgi:Ca2+-binding RTX toxin-like protein